MAVQDILISHVNVYYAPLGTANPDETSIDFDEAWGSNWTNLGLTLTPLTASVNENIFKLEVEQYLSAVKGNRDKEDWELETTLAELTLEALKLATNSTSAITTTAAGAGQKGFKEFSGGGEVNLAYYKFGFEGYVMDSNNNKLPFRWFFHKCSFSLGGTIEFSKKAAAGIPLKIVAWIDTSQPAGQQIYTIQKVTAIATS